MAKLNNLNRFQYNVPTLDRPRCKIGRDYTSSFTFNSGYLIPFYVHEVLPGETTKLNLSNVIRSSTPASPVMDTAFIDYMFFFVPSRLCTANEKDWQHIFGQNDSNYWAPATESDLDNTGNTYSLYALTNTTLNGQSYKVAPQSLLNYLGVPVLKNTEATAEYINTLVPRAYYAIWNEWFRDENTQAPADFNSKKSYLGAADSDSNTALLKVNKYHDLFSSVLPGPQKSNYNVALPLGSMAPVITTGDIHQASVDKNTALHFAQVDGGILVSGRREELNGRTDTQGITLGVDDDSNLALVKNQENSNGLGAAVSDTGYAPYENYIAGYPDNLWADLSRAVGSSINELRNAFAIQRLFERDARSGTRYFEFLLAGFGCSNPDLVLQRPEYLAGKRVPLNITQVIQTAPTASTLLGATGAFSNTANSDYMFTKSFGEYGYIIGVCCVRTSQSYGQGLPKFMLRRKRFDFYDPVFANLGEQPILKKELYFRSNDSKNNQVFGYQEAWADYRYHYNQVLGYFNPDAPGALSNWTYATQFTDYPTLNSDFMVQSKSNIDQTLAVRNGPYQFIANSYFQEELSLPMPVYSIPGLIDHH